MGLMIDDIEGFRIDVVPNSCQVTLVIYGDIDLATAHQVDEHLRGVELSRRDVVIDLAEVAFMDAAALRVLICSDRRLQATGRRLTLRNASGSPKRVLAVAGLSDIFELVA